MSSPSARSEAGVSPARRAAFEVLRRTFEHGAWADRAFRSAAERHGLRGGQRALAQHLAYGSVQRRATADRLAEQLARRSIDDIDQPLRAALRLGLYELLFTREPAQHAVVGEAVELAKGGMGGGPRAAAAAGLVNAVLRRAAREGEGWLAGLDDSAPEGAAIAHSYPEWLARRWWDELGPDAARSLMASMNEPPERALRVNPLRADAPGSPAGDPLRLPETFIPEERWGEDIRARIDAGELVPQSRASQAVVALLDPRPGERVLDLCAGPGIKSTHMAARMEDRGEIRSLELSEVRAGEIGDLARKLGAGCIRPQVGDASVADLGAGYDRVLVDPPCTDLGTLASRPDARWRKTAEDAERLAAIQEAITARGAAALRPGGTLVYATCTISRRENEDVALAVLEGDETLAPDDLGASYPALASTHDLRFLQTRPDRDRTDGFFIARLRRQGG
jgi:16S rRNA (cytosine967-C5)-methyltransferase